MKSRFYGRAGLQQRVLPSYRVPFFDKLAEACDGGLSVFSGKPQAREGIVDGQLRVASQARAQNIHLFSGPFYLCQQRGFGDWLRSWNPDVLIAEANPRYLATAGAVRWMHNHGRKVIGWGLGATPLTGAWAPLRRAMRLRLLRQFDALIAYSQRGADEYAALGFPGDKIFVANNAVTDRPAHAPKPKAPRFEQPTILFVGRLQARKRVDWLLQACAEMPEPKPRLLIVGDGPEGEALRRMASSVYPNAEFAGAKHGEALEPYFAQADLFVLPGTGGLAVQEAMAYGLPVIVAKGDGTQDDLVRAGNGWQIPPEDQDALSRTMRLALTDPRRLRKMGKESFRIVSEEINVEKMVEVFVDAMRD